jgi:hypothetical protein
LRESDTLDLGDVPLGHESGVLDARPELPCGDRDASDGSLGIEPGEEGWDEQLAVAARGAPVPSYMDEAKPFTGSGRAKLTSRAGGDHIDGACRPVADE